MERDHKDGTIPEVFLDRAFTNILWLSNPSIEIQINKIIASCCRGVFVNPIIWKKFLDIFNDLKRGAFFSDKDLATLLYNNYLEEMLAGYTPKDLDKITPEFVKENLTEAKKKMQTKINNIILDVFYVLRLLIIAIVGIHLMILSIMYIKDILTNYYLIILALVFFVILIVASGIGPFKKFWVYLADIALKKLNIAEQ